MSMSGSRCKRRSCGRSPRSSLLWRELDRGFECSRSDPGLGDVALVVAEIVGPRGRVLGVDRDAVGLEQARERTRQQGCSSWVRFQASDLDELDVPDQFDAIAGRYILLYQHDPGTTIRHLLKFLKPGVGG